MPPHSIFLATPPVWMSQTMSEAPEIEARECPSGE